MSGRHGVPSLKVLICLDASAPATKSFKTRSNRSRSLIPQAVANRRQVVVNASDASELSSRSVLIFDLAYAVRGLRGSSSRRGPPSAQPYTLQLEAKTNLFTPSFFAC